MKMEQAAGAVEALLFATNAPLSHEKIRQVLEIDEATLRGALAILEQRYSGPESGVGLQRVAGGLLLSTTPQTAPYVERLIKTRPAPLSQAALETLAIVAYRQPVTRAEIDAIRGVKSGSSVNTLLERNMIREVGRKQVIGRPMLYGTTTEFLRQFGLNSLEDLPEVRVDEAGE